MPLRWRMAIGVLFLLAGAAVGLTARKPATRAVHTTQPAKPTTNNTNSRMSIPDESAQAGALKLIRQVFAAEYADRTVAGRKALGRKLLTQGLQTRDDLTGRFVLLRESANLSAGAADLSTALRAVDALADQFDLSRLLIRREALRTAQAIAQGAGLEALANACLRTIDLAVADDQYDDAVELASMAESAAQRSKDLPLIKEIHQRQNELLFLRNQFQRVQPILVRLSHGSDDPAGRSEAGVFLCAVKGDWEHGLPLLAGGSDTACRSAAEADLANPADPTAQLHVGHGWWDLAPAGPWLIRRNFRLRAADWYRKSQARLSGFSRSLVKQRLAELDAQEIHLRGLQSGLSAELFTDEGFAHCLKTRIDPRIDFDFGNQSPDPQLPKDHFSIRWTGLLHPSAAGKYAIVVIANTGARLWLNDQLLIDAPDLTHSRKGRAAMVDLPEGFHPITLEFWDGTGTAKIKLAWTTPLDAHETPIPANALFHQPDEDGIHQAENSYDGRP